MILPEYRIIICEKLFITTMLQAAIYEKCVFYRIYLNKLRRVKS